MSEEWRPIEGFENYVVSNYGRVQNLTTGRTLKNSVQQTKTPYLRVGLCKNGIMTSRPVHRLVAIAFLPGVDLGFPYVTHKDGNLENNHVDNLEWKGGTKTLKRCPTCQHIMPREDFQKNKRRPDGLNSECRECVKKRGLKRKNKE